MSETNETGSSERDERERVEPGSDQEQTVDDGDVGTRDERVEMGELPEREPERYSSAQEPEEDAVPARTEPSEDAGSTESSSEE